MFGSRTFVPLTWLCKKQTCVSHSSTEAEFVALDAALRLEGLPCLQFWELVVSVFSQDEEHQKFEKALNEPLTARGDLQQNLLARGDLLQKAFAQDPFDVDFVPPSFPWSLGNSRL